MDRKDQREIVLWAVLPPLVLIGGYLLGAYGTLSPCAAVDQALTEQMRAELATERSLVHYAAVAAVPSIRRSISNSPVQCLMALARYERIRFQAAVRGY